MEAWQKVWRKGFAPVLPVDGLKALREAIINDDPCLIQGSTTSPPPMDVVKFWPVEGTCAVTYCGWKGADAGCVGEAEVFFARICYEADQLLEEPAACRHFLNWYDDTPRNEMRKELLAEVELALKEQKEQQ